MGRAIVKTEDSLSVASMSAQTNGPVLVTWSVSALNVGSREVTISEQALRIYRGTRSKESGPRSRTSKSQ